MSADIDFDRDQRLADRLGQLPPPPLPPGLAARIAANAARLPQDRDEPVAEAIAPSGRPRWRWLPHAVGTALAASVVAALFLRQGPADPVPRTTGVQVAYKAPASLPQTKPTDLVAAPSPEHARAASRPKPGKHVGKASDDPSQSPAPQPAPPTVEPSSPNQAPELASQQDPAIKEEPAAQAFVGPPAIDERGAPMLQSAPVSGLGISGTGTGTGTASPGPAPAPTPSRQGRGASTMPRF
jgi:hypothetical protein